MFSMSDMISAMHNLKLCLCSEGTETFMTWPSYTSNHAVCQFWLCGKIESVFDYCWTKFDWNDGNFYVTIVSL